MSADCSLLGFSLWECSDIFCFFNSMSQRKHKSTQLLLRKNTPPNEVHVIPSLQCFVDFMNEYTEVHSNNFRPNKEQGKAEEDMPL